MNTKPIRLRTEFAPATRFELRPAPPAPFRASRETEFERLKDQLLAEQLFLAKDPEAYAPLRRVANEAAALAWTSAFPLLFFPGLFAEKVATLALQAEHQKRVRLQTAEPMAA